METQKEENRYFDRDLSWLTFNYRVLKEAQSPDVPLLERLKFLAIYSANQDEFFRVRVATIRNYIKLNRKKINKALDYDPNELLQTIHKKVGDQLIEYSKTLQKGVLPDLADNGVFILEPERLNQAQKSAVLYYFKTEVLGYLQPHVFGVTNRDPFLNNRELYFALRLQNKYSEVIDYAFLNIPSNIIPRFFQLPSPDVQFHYIFIDDIIRMNLDFVFPDYNILECQSIKMNKDAYLHIDDEFSGDLVEKIQNQIKKRDLGVPARFLYDQNTTEPLLNYIKDAFDLTSEDLVSGGHYHSLFDFFQLPNPIGKSIEYEPLPQLRHSRIDKHRSIFNAIDEADRMLHFPYHTYNYVLQFFNQSAIDPHVKEIKVTFYRMASNSLIGNALISASQNGKRVTVFMELKARFDEANNIRWAEKMKNAGVRIIYSIPGLKVHAKVALVKKKTDKGLIKNYCFFGTGNLNEKTASTYADHGLLTCDQIMGEELDDLFKYLYRRKEPNEFKSLLVSQFNIIEGYSQLIDREIAHAKSGQKAHIIIKLNNLEERGMIDKLYEASRAGVRIQMIVRSICCLIPGIVGMSENITVRRIVGRYLEHGRVFWFHNNGEDELYMGSADWMKRNLKSRIEVNFPIKRKRLKDQLMQLLKIQLKDNTKAVELDQNMENILVERSEGSKLYNAQIDSYHAVKMWEELGDND